MIEQLLLCKPIWVPQTLSGVIIEYRAKSKYAWALLGGSISPPPPSPSPRLSLIWLPMICLIIFQLDTDVFLTSKNDRMPLLSLGYKRQWFLLCWYPLYCFLIQALLKQTAALMSWIFATKRSEPENESFLLNFKRWPS